VDPKTHTRFLTYLESYEYFRRPGLAKLAREQWIALDAELRELLAREKPKLLGAPEPPRVKELRRMLLRD
jgi:hypothetical protein